MLRIQEDMATAISKGASTDVIRQLALESGMVQEEVLLSNALIRHKMLPDMALNMLAIGEETGEMDKMLSKVCLLYTSPSPRDRQKSRMPSSA